MGCTPDGVTDLFGCKGNNSLVFDVARAFSSILKTVTWPIPFTNSGREPNFPRRKDWPATLLFPTGGHNRRLSLAAQYRSSFASRGAEKGGFDALPGKRFKVGGNISSILSVMVPSTTSATTSSIVPPLVAFHFFLPSPPGSSGISRNCFR